MSQQKNLVAPKKLSKQEIQANKVEEARLRSLAKDVMFPILLNNAKSIKDAKNMLKTMVVGMNALFTKKLKEYEKYLNEDKLSILELNENMNSPEEYPAEHAMAEALKDETVSCAMTMIQGMEAELDRLTDEELKNRPLSDLKMEWL